MPARTIERTPERTAERAMREHLDRANAAFRTLGQHELEYQSHPKGGIMVRLTESPEQFIDAKTVRNAAAAAAEHASEEHRVNTAYRLNTVEWPGAPFVIIPRRVRLFGRAFVLPALFNRVVRAQNNALHVKFVAEGTSPRRALELLQRRNRRRE